VRYFVSLGDETTQVDVEELATGEYRVKHSGAEHVVRLEGENVLIGAHVVPSRTDARRGVVDVRHASLPFMVSRENPETARSAAASHRPELRAPMPGKVVDVRVAEGSVVTRGQCVIVIEAMKMQNELSVTSPARIKRLHVQVGQAVEAGALLVELDLEPA
jgi:biotin carboxyl carrier protein